MLTSAVTMPPEREHVFDRLTEPLFVDRQRRLVVVDFDGQHAEGGRPCEMPPPGFDGVFQGPKPSAVLGYT